RAGAAVQLFRATVIGLPPESVPPARSAQFCTAQEALAHPLAYDAELMGGDYRLPVERVAEVPVPTLVLDGGASFPFLPITAQAVADLLPHAERRTLEGQTHEVAADAIAPVLTEFFAA